MITYKIKNGMLEDADIRLLENLELAIFPEAPHDFDFFKYEMSEMKNLLTLFALDGDRVIAFKVGHEKKKEQFYSWVGGVIPEYRGRGIAKMLMEKQHSWLSENGYKRVQTHTGNEFRAMLCLNIKNGFNIKGTTLNSKGKIRVILEKVFDEHLVI